jgi:hypothetical protein
MTINDDLIEIPIDGIDLDFEPDGMPKAVPAKTQASKPKADGKPPISADDLSAAQRAAQSAQAERDEARRAAQAERDARVRAEQEAEKRTGQAASLFVRSLKADRDHLASAESTVSSELDRLEQDMARASETMDSKAQASIAREMASLTTKLEQLRQGKSSLEGKIRSAEAEIEAASRAPRDQERDPELAQQPQEPPKKAPQTPEEWIGQFPRKVAGWLSDNKDFVTDRTKNEEFVRFVKEYTDDYGPLAVQTPQFVAELKNRFAPPAEESDVADEQTNAHGGEVEAPAEPAAKRSAPAAPVSRSTPGRPSSSGNSITLTREQHTIAVDMFPSYNDLDADVKAKFPNGWSETAARFQYHKNLKRAESDGKFR